MILRIDFAFPLAIFAAVMDLVPTVGPLLGAGLAVWLRWRQTRESSFGLVSVILSFISCEQSDWLKIQGSQMKIHPAFIIILTVSERILPEFMGFIYRPSAHDDHFGYIKYCGIARARVD